MESTSFGLACKASTTESSTSSTGTQPRSSHTASPRSDEFPRARSTTRWNGNSSSRPTRGDIRSSRRRQEDETMGRKSRFESEALQFAYERYIGRDKKKAEAFDAELENAEVARQLYDLRMQAGLTQAALAKLVGTTASAISRLEDDDDGHSLARLRRIAAGLNKRVEIRFVPLKRATGTA